MPNSSRKSRVPRTIHFIFLHPGRFGYLHYLAVKTAYEVNRPERICFHCAEEAMHNPHWCRAMAYCDVERIQPVTEFHGHRVEHYQHQTDILRLEVLLTRGGIYLDADVLCLNPLDGLLDYPCVLGEEQADGSSLSNAVILAEPGAEFTRRWYRALPEDWNKTWAYNAVVLPRLLAEQGVGPLHVEPHTTFIPFSFRETQIFDEVDPAEVSNLAGRLRESRCLHLWQTIWWERYLKDLTPSYFQENDTAFGRLFRHHAA
jgi:hypothetical protein